MSQNSSDCLECRLSSGGGLVGASIYIIYHARKFQPLGRYFLMGFGSGIGVLGVFRIFNLPPFKISSNPKEEIKEDIGATDNYIVGRLPTKFLK